MHADKFNCHCLKCGARWFSSKYHLTGVPPKECIKCHSYSYDKPRVRKSRTH